MRHKKTMQRCQCPTLLYLFIQDGWHHRLTYMTDLEINTEPLLDTSKALLQQRNNDNV